MVRKAPKWFKDLLAAERSRYFQGAATEGQAGDALAGAILANPDQRFAASIIADYVRHLIDPPTSRADRDLRRARAVELRDEGLSIRKIAARFGVDEKTIRLDLARWDADHANVAELRNSSAESRPEIPQQNSAPAAVIAFRRSS